MPPELIFGTASFGMDQTDFQGPSSIVPLLEELQRLDITRLDSGARYPPGKPGLAEKLAGEVLPERGFVVDTKVYTDVTNDGSGDLAAEAVERSVVGSLERLMRPQVCVSQGSGLCRVLMGVGQCPAYPPLGSDDAVGGAGQGFCGAD